MARLEDMRNTPGPSQLAPADRKPALALVGISHRTAQFEDLERAALDDRRARQALRELTGSRDVREAAVVATCNRTEVYMVSDRLETAAERARGLLEREGLPGNAGIYVQFGRDVAAHLFRVAAGIDSLMMGEVQILGQVKDALRVAEDERTAGVMLSKLFVGAFRAGKHARSETDIGRGPVSISYAALGLARKIFTDLRERTLLVVGAGKAGALAARHFAEAGIGALVVVNRTDENAAELAGVIGGRAMPWADLEAALGLADVVVTATASPRPIIRRSLVESARGGRTNRALVFIDIAHPRDVEAEVNQIEGVFVHDMTALESIVQRNLERRRREVPKVEAIVAREVERYESWQRSLGIGPTITALRARFEALRDAEIETVRSAADPETLATLERVTRSLLAKILHQPLVRMRRPRPGQGDSIELAAAVRELFDLDTDLGNDGDRKPR